ncbi:5'-methylthioadenosine/adenosylhomocysteine nucleosidase [Enterococcus sp. BWT-B8]|uniref:5'-methylthioadenosine/adenosylhomocysteine nucleosidase n=1 Tax=unclassified Enterococcus TaxID=2608891 RepID=UPI001E607442|nr:MULTISPECIES: 5'-methylthioadenosine/adenosylhomocysteine nucleosidase [unclassified Enterococcus]MCB5952990.1 5'-methylthioadenosine/adenosylhomocysteine nucleosidase [Enterococcus sp. BWT-B8]MCB5956253.1 5'-methylthioadenosine/adenosylhomocysteine nucleosidase [Enterococcus sp. CWB-B31]
MKIGIIGAMEQEIEALKEVLTEKRSWERAGAVFISGSLGNHEVIVVRSGIGKVLSAVTTVLLIHQYGVNMVINTGSAGGIGHGLAVGDIVIADKLAYFDVDVTGFGYKKGQLPGMPLYYECSSYLKAEMKKAVEKVGLPVRNGLIVTGDSFIDSKEKIESIVSDFPDALACEMEGASIAQAAAQFNIPFLVVRAISDTADHEATQSFDDFIEDAGKKSAEMVIVFIKHLV